MCPKTRGRWLELWVCPTLRAGLRSRQLPSHFQESLQPSLFLPRATTSTLVLWGHYQVKWGLPESMHTICGDSCPSCVRVCGNSIVQTMNYNYQLFFWIFNLIVNCHWLSATEFMEKENKEGGKTVPMPAHGSALGNRNLQSHPVYQAGLRWSFEQMDPGNTVLLDVFTLTQNKTSETHPCRDMHQ